MTPKNDHTLDLCPVCSRYGPSHKHHIATRAIDPDFIRRLCAEDHITYVHPRLRQWGFPGTDEMGPDKARFIGAASWLLVTMQRHNDLGNDQAALLGELMASTYLTPSRRRPVRSAPVTDEQGSNVLQIQAVFGVLYDAFRLALLENERKLSREKIERFSAMGYFCRVVSENPLRYQDFLESTDTPLNVDALLKFAGRHGKPDSDDSRTFMDSALDHAGQFESYLVSLKTYGAEVTV